jgi:hypothetical protein
VTSPNQAIAQAPVDYIEGNCPAAPAADVTVASGVCNGAGVSDPAGNRILLHHRYKPYDR